VGLDLMAFSNVAVLPRDHGRSEYECLETWVDAFAYKGFHRSTRGLADHDVVADQWGLDLIAVRDYDITGSTTHSWRGGSYSGYGRRRAELARFADIPDAHSVSADAMDLWIDEHQEKPFFELVWFADNEGAIGHEAARDLLADFVAHRDELLAPARSGDTSTWLSESWIDDWIRGLTLAANDGLVRFR